MFKGTLRNYQKDSANKLCQRKRELLALPQGLGKTVIAIAAAEKLLELGWIQRVLILCPTGIGWQWREKLEEFSTRVDVRYVEAKNKSSRTYGTDQAVYTIVPYSVFRRDAEEIKLLKADLIIADEAQEFSNFRSKTYKLIKQFKSTYRWALTGTAISNKLEELYAIMQWVDPYFLPGWQRFEKLHLIRNPHTKQILRYKNLEPLNKYLLSQRLDRKTIEELQSSLPEVITHKIYTEKDKDVGQYERKLYHILDSYNSHNIASNLSFDPGTSQALHEVRQALCRSKIDYSRALLERIASESSNNSIVLFSFYKQPLYDLSASLKLPTRLFTGDESPDEKRLAIQAFKNREVQVLLCSNAGKAGLDVPFANYTIHLDVPFSHGISDQRSTRTRRVSSEYSTVIVIYLLVKDSVEEFYFDQTIAKGTLAKAALEGGIDKVTVRPQSLKEYLTQYYGPRAKDRAIQAAKAE